MNLHSTILVAWLLGLTFLILPHTALGQSSDSAPPSAPASPPARDSLPRDTLAAESPGRSADTASKRTGSDTARADSGVTVDSARKQEGGDTAKAEAVVSPLRDSILLESCRNPAGAGVAPDLLVVIFAAEATREDRDAAARSVDGTLLGSVKAEPGAYYLRVSSGEESGLRAAADRLAQLPLVRQVGSRSCLARTP